MHAPAVADPDLQQRVSQAMAWHQQGRADLALPIYEQWMRAQPAESRARHLLGLAFLDLGQPLKALSHLDEAVAIAPNGPDYRLHRGMAHHALRHIPEAAADYQAAAALAPADPAPWVNLSALHHDAGDAVAAASAARKATQIGPGVPQAWNNLGRALYTQGDFAAAEASLRHVIALHPVFPEAYLNLADAVRAQGRGAESESIYLQALQQNPRLAAAWVNLGNYYALVGRSSEALRAYEKTLEIDPRHPEASANLCGTLVECGREDEAVPRLQAFLADGVGTPHHYAALAWALRVQERTDEAIAALRKTGEARDHTVVKAWAELALVRPDLRPDAIARVEGWLQQEARSAPLTQRAEMQLTLAELLDKQGDYPRAFAAARAGKALHPERSDPAQEQATATALERVFTARRLRQPPFGLEEEERPLFIVGMPRSGTSLIEQILAAHPAVYAAGEVEELGRITGELAGGNPAAWPARAAALDAGSLEALAQRWLHPLTQAAGGAQRIVDKMPHNFEKLGLIALLFPKARVIHIQRDPRDICLSIFFHSFTGYHPYANDLEDLARHYLYYHRLMAHWRAVLPLPLLELRYEDLIAEPDAHIRRLLAFAGLPWDAQVEQFHASRRQVLTASRFQVREPIHRRAAGRWQRYARQLAPLVDILASILPDGVAEAPQKPCVQPGKAVN